MSGNRSKISMDPLEGLEEEEISQKVKILKKILKNYQLWFSLVESEGLFFITIDGEEFFIYEMLEGITLLPKRQRQAVELICLHDMKETDAAKVMGFTKWSEPAQQYCHTGLRKLVAYHEGKKLQRVRRYRSAS